jgi:hypothetical protein
LAAVGAGAIGLFNATASATEALENRFQQHHPVLLNNTGNAASFATGVTSGHPQAKLSTVRPGVSMLDGLLPKKGRSRPRLRDAERNRRHIIEAARAEFAKKGLSGARVSEIAARARTTKPMIYYYFDSKEKLYQQVMEEVCATCAMSSRACGTFDYHAVNTDYVRLIAVEQYP